MIDAAFAELDVCDLRTIGRTSGLARDVEIWFAVEGDRVYLLSGGRDEAHWVRNLQANPEVWVLAGGRTFRGKARIIEGDADDPHARRLLAAKYQGWREGRPLSAWATTSLPLAIDLVAEEA